MVRSHESCANRRSIQSIAVQRLMSSGFTPKNNGDLLSLEVDKLYKMYLDEPEGEHSVAGGGTLAWIHVLPRGSSIRGPLELGHKRVLRGLLQQGLEVGFQMMVAMLMKKPRSMKTTASFEKVDGS